MGRRKSKREYVGTKEKLKNVKTKKIEVQTVKDGLKKKKHYQLLKVSNLFLFIYLLIFALDILFICLFVFLWGAFFPECIFINLHSSFLFFNSCLFLSLTFILMFLFLILLYHHD